jgi:hypothetical protein
MLKNRIVQAAAATALTAAAMVAVPGIASAAVETKNCGNGGFFGYIRYNAYYRNGYVYHIDWIEYRIDKGSRVGGNNANVVWQDYGSQYGGTDKGIQDNQWHRILGAYARAKKEDVLHRFVFDQSLGSDPECSIRWTM